MTQLIFRMALSVALLFAMGAAWAGHVAFSKIIDAHSLSEIAAVMVVYMSVTAPLLLFSLLIYERRMPSFRGAGVFLSITALGGYLLPVVLELAVMPHVPLAIYMFVGTLTPAVTLGLTGLLGIDRIGWFRSAGLAFGIWAVYLVLGNPFAEASETGVHSQGWNFYYLLLLLVPILYGTVDLFIERQWPKGISQLQVAAGDACVAFVYVLIFALIAGAKPEQVMTVATNKTFAVLGVTFLAIISTVTYFSLVRYAGAVYVSFGAMVALLIGMVIGHLFFAEVLPANFWFAMLILTISLLFLNLGSRKRQNTHTG